MDRLRRGAENLCAKLRSNGYRALFAGGCVRDLIRGEAPSDYDIATSATPEQVSALFPKTVSVGAAFGVQVVLDDDIRYEVATFRRDGDYVDGRHPSTVEFADEEQDARRRDFTINALFMDPATSSVIDYVEGRADIESGIVRTVGDPHQRFREDHLRMLRACRFAARFDYTIASATMDAIRANAALIVRVSAERKRDELIKMITGPRPRCALMLLDDTGLLEELLPEVSAMKGVEQPAEFHPEGDVFVHTLLAMEQLADPSPALALGLLLHDVGKPPTQTFEDRIRFNNHDAVGTKMAREICLRFHLSNALSDRVCWLVSQHMRVAATPSMRASKLKRLVREPGFPELLELYRCDCEASHNNLDTYRWLKAYAENLPEEEAKPEPLVQGRHLIEWGYDPGPQFSEILEAVEDAQLDGTIASLEEARKFVTERWP